MWEKESDDGLYTLATGYAGEQARKKDIAYDVIGEFANVCSGLFASGLSEKGVNVDMESPFAYEDQQMKGKGYIVPIYLRGKELELFISVNEDVVPEPRRIRSRLENRREARSQRTARVRS